MGLDISHDAWHGAYSAFHRYRKEIARLAGFPPLELMEGFYDPESHNAFTMPTIYLRDNKDALYGIEELKKQLPIKWHLFRANPLVELLYHSDCDGYISYGKCKKIADELEKLLPLMNGEGGGHIGDWKEKTEIFIKGLRLAHSKKQRLEFR